LCQPLPLLIAVSTLDVLVNIQGANHYLIKYNRWNEHRLGRGVPTTNRGKFAIGSPPPTEGKRYIQLVKDSTMGVLYHTFDILSILV